MNKNVIAEIRSRQIIRSRRRRSSMIDSAAFDDCETLLAELKVVEAREAVLREALRLLAAPVITIVRMSWTHEQAADSYWAELDLRRALASKALTTGPT